MSDLAMDLVAAAPAGPTLLGNRQSHATETSKGKAPTAVEPADCYAVEWAQAAKRFADLNALVFDGVGVEHRFTFEELETNANRLAWSLARMGIGMGDRVVTISENRPEMVVLLLSCLKLGITFVPLATDLRPQDCKNMVARYEPSLVISDQPQFAAIEQTGGGEYRTLLLPPFEAQWNQLKEMMAEGSGEPVPAPVVPASVPAIIFSTSGSTALPKGVMYSHADLAGLAAWGEAIMDAKQARTKHLMWVSMRGIAATVMLLKHLLQGALTVMVDSYSSGPCLWSELIDKHAINSHILFGAAMNQTLQELPKRTFESVRTITYGGSCFAPTLIQRSMDQFPNASFVQIYGMTEVHPISMLGPEFHRRAHDATVLDVLRMTSAGRIVIPGSVFIEDLERPGSGLAPAVEKNGVGQVCAWSAVTMMGYYANPEKTTEVMPDGKFVRTGDIGRIDEDGFLYIVGRTKDIIPAYKGFNVAPRDLEEVLYSHPSVGQASVVGVWHPSGAGEAVVAWARAKAGARLSAGELRGHFRESGLASWQMPDAIHVSREALPTTGGKIDAKALRADAFRRTQLAAELAAAGARAASGALAGRGDASEREALAAELCEASSGRLCRDKMSSTFGEAASALATGGREALLAALRAMSGEEYESFQLHARALLGSWAAGKVVLG